MPVTLRFQSTGAVPGDGAPIVMRGPSLTIGRGQENDVVLPDPDRQISKNHCAIEDQNGNVVVIDFSTNGTFLNYGKVPLGRVPTPLNDGDVLTMGSYEMVVAISTGRADPLRDLAPPVDDGPVSHGRAEAAPDLMDLLNDHSSKRVDFLDDLMGAAPPRGPSTVVREDPIDELDLPHLRDAEDPILGRLPDPLDDVTGASVRYNSPSLTDGFSAPGAKSSVIPDDWDDDFLSPNPKPRGGGGRPASDPFAAPAPPPRSAQVLPPDAFDDLLPPEPAAAPEPAAPPVPVAPLSAASVVPRPPRAKTPAEVVADAASPFAAAVPPGRMTSVVPPPPAAQAPVAAQPVAAQPAPPPAQAAVAPAPIAAPASPARAPASPPVSAGAQHDALRAFFEGAGAEDLVIPDAEMAATMARLGLVVRILIEGLRDILMTRASIKGEFRMERTQISAGGNNPLKFAFSPEHAVEMILRPKAKGYMDAPTAVKEALDDIKAHEVAMVTGMEAAIKDVLARLDPAVLSVRVGGGGLGGLLGGKKARYWEEFERLYGTIAGEAENDFHEFFAKAFAKAYQDQLERLK